MHQKIAKTGTGSEPGINYARSQDEKVIDCLRDASCWVICYSRGLPQNVWRHRRLMM